MLAGPLPSRPNIRIHQPGTRRVREAEDNAALPPEALPQYYVVAIEKLAADITSDSFKVANNLARISEMTAALRQRSAATYENGLTWLGRLLGADAFKPDGHGNCDSVWGSGNEMWVTLEAKPEEGAEHELSMDSIRQAHSHLQLLSSVRSTKPPFPNAASVVISPRTMVSTGAIAAAQAHSCTRS